MSTLRRTFRVAWDDGPLVEVTTNAWDMAAAQEFASNETKAVFALVHHALKREGHQVKSLDWFVSHLDEMEPEDKEEEAEPLPTLLVDSGSAVLPLHSSQEQTPESGSTTTNYSSQQSVS